MDHRRHRPKKGEHSVGVTRQYCGQLGKQDNSTRWRCRCRFVNRYTEPAGGLPICICRKTGRRTSNRRRKTGVLMMSASRSKPEIALEQIAAACKAGLPLGVVLMDAGYGCNTDLRIGVSALGLRYVAGILPNTSDVDIGHGAVADHQKMVGPGASTEAHPPGRQASTGLGQAIGSRLAKALLGARFSGARGRLSGCPRALRRVRVRCRCIAIAISTTAGRKSGC